MNSVLWRIRLAIQKLRLDGDKTNKNFQRCIIEIHLSSSKNARLLTYAPTYVLPAAQVHADYLIFHH